MLWTKRKVNDDFCLDKSMPAGKTKKWRKDETNNFQKIRKKNSLSTNVDSVFEHCKEDFSSTLWKPRANSFKPHLFTFINSLELQLLRSERQNRLIGKTCTNNFTIVSGQACTINPESRLCAFIRLSRNVQVSITHQGTTILGFDRINSTVGNKMLE
jgi:hypothetical protein